MIRHVIIGTESGLVVNVVEYEQPVTGQPPGMDEQFLAVASNTAQIGWEWDGKTMTDPNPPQPNLKVMAYAELDFSDRVATRCIKAGVPYPSEWRDRDIILRAIVKDTIDSTELPPRPDYPAST